jgi:Domain of unknown function (DUF4115)
LARLRIRIELSRGGVGVPLHKLSNVISETQKFLHNICEDLGIDKSRGEWLIFDFDRESLDFTAEFIGPVTPVQVEAFNAAFDGSTSLRRATIAQFARIADAIGEDEVIGFGLFQSDETQEPSEWRCLSRRDALRIADEIQRFLGIAQELDAESHLPGARDPALGARLFGDRRDREIESNLASRLSRVEKRIEQHSSDIEDLHTRAAATDAGLRTLLTTIEEFCGQATRQLERAVPPSQPAALPAAAEPTAITPALSRWWPRVSVVVAAAAVVALILWLWPARSVLDPSVKSSVAASQSKEPLPVPSAAPSPSPTPAPTKSAVMRIDIEATEPAWVSMTDIAGNKLLNTLLVPGAPRTFEVATTTTLRTGNAAGLLVKVDGRAIGPIGPRGQVRDVYFKDGTFKIGMPKSE